MCRRRRQKGSCSLKGERGSPRPFFDLNPLSALWGSPSFSRYLTRLRPPGQAHRSSSRLRDRKKHVAGQPLDSSRRLVYLSGS